MPEVLTAAGGGTYRWPAGTIAENYLWHPHGEWDDAVKGLRPRPVSVGKFRWKDHLGEDGFFVGTMDFDEFVGACRGSGAEPIVMVPSYGWKLPEAEVDRAGMIASAREWVRYANVTRDYGVKYWEIGNEVDLKKCPLSLEEYLDYFGEVTVAMKSVDPEIRVGIGLLRGSAEDYFEAAFKRFPEQIDFCVVHQYHSYHTNFAHYGRHDSTYIKSIEEGLRSIDRYAPPEVARDMELLVTEFSAYSPQQVWENDEPTVTKALLTFEMMGSALTADSRVRSMNFWITRSPWRSEVTYADALKADNSPTAMGAVIELMGSSLKRQMGAAPRVAGDIRTYATFDPEDGSLTIFLLNKAAEERPVTVVVRGIEPGDTATGEMRVFKGADGPTSSDFVLRDGGDVPLTHGQFQLDLPPASITAVGIGED